jgi:hypothetical protein
MGRCQISAELKGLFVAGASGALMPARLPRSYVTWRAADNYRPAADPGRGPFPARFKAAACAAVPGVPARDRGTYFQAKRIPVRVMKMG